MRNTFKKIAFQRAILSVALNLAVEARAVDEALSKLFGVVDSVRIRHARPSIAAFLLANLSKRLAGGQAGSVS